MKPGDRAVHIPTARAFTVAVLDTLTGRVCIDSPDREEWVAITEVELRAQGTRADERAMLLKIAKLNDRRGLVARTEVARQWTDETWNK